ncbi:MAG: VOC family protein [Candidatus Acidiferrales bacterium]
MATAGVKPIPEGYRAITPYLTVREAPQLLDFLLKAFGAVVLYKGTGGAGGMHAELKIGDSRLMLGGGGAYPGPYFPTAIHLKVNDVDQVYARALEAGGISLHPPQDFEYGERGAGVKDLCDDQWYIATPKGKTHFLPEMGTITPYLHPHGASDMVQFLKNALGAVEMMRENSADGTVQHAKIKIGDSILEMSEAHGEYQPMPSMFYLYVNDVDACYARALKAGGKSIEALADQSYGDRRAGIADPFGNHWYMATRVKDVPQ